jgi:hypothetical protein
MSNGDVSRQPNANGEAARPSKKQKLPTTDFFFSLAMQRSAEIKSQQEPASEEQSKAIQMPTESRGGTDGAACG